MDLHVLGVSFVQDSEVTSRKSSVKSSSDEREREGEEEEPVTVLTEGSPSMATFRRERGQGRRKKPTRPRPYSDHMADKERKVRF